MTSKPQLARANGIELCYESFGSEDADPLILIMGLGAQMIHWDDEFCEDLAARGFRVTRFDNRDIGKSTRLSGGKKITLFEMMKLRVFGWPISAPYTLIDMAKDTIGLMDHLNISSAHIVGASMGGMIAQELAINFPDRVTTLTSIMSTTGNPRLPAPTREATAMLLAPPPTTYEQFLARFSQTWKMLRAGTFPDDEAKDLLRAERTYARGLNPAGVNRQFRAILASGDRTSRLKNVRIPTLVIHGDVDPLVRTAAGRATAEAISGSQLVIIEGMGHALPIVMWPEIINAITDHAHGVGRPEDTRSDTSAAGVV